MRKLHYSSRAIALLAFFAPLPALAATYYVAPTGSDTAAGTLAAPWATIGKAQTVVAAGDTVYFRGGRYVFTTATNTCGGSTSATVDSVVLSKSGTSGNPINYWAYPGEKPVFDFSGVTDMTQYNCRHSGVRVTGNYLYLKGLEMTGVLQLNNLNHESWCLYIFGSYNTFELIDAHHNMGPGIFIQQGGHNLVLNCDSHENEDTLTSNGDGQSGDGFGCHPTVSGTASQGNVFRGCRAWWNSDDGWDFIHAVEVCTVENSWVWYQGYKPDALSGGAPVALAAGNGNGFKGGGYDMPPTGVPANPPQHIIQQNVAFFNKASGFYANHSPVSQYFYNNTGYHNSPDFNMLGVASDGSTSISVGILRNNIAFAGSLTSNMTLGGGLIDDQYNSWDSNMGLTVTNGDFQSVTFAPPASCPAAYSPGGTVCVPPTDMTSFAGMASARQADGSLPCLPFLRLASGSNLIAKGINVGLPYSGSAPNLGALDPGCSTAATGGAPSTGGASSTGGTPATGGSKATGGSATAGTGGSKATGGSATASVGGSKATGGATSAVGGGATTTGGANAAGGSPGAGGALASTGGLANGGSKATGGAPAGTGGNTAAAGAPTTGGALSAGGALGSGGVIGSLGGASVAATGGALSAGGNGSLGGASQTDTNSTTGGGGNSSDNAGSCSCRVPSSHGSPMRNAGVLALIGLAAAGLQRRRRVNRR